MNSSKLHLICSLISHICTRTTVLCKTNGPRAILWCKMAFFKRAWQKVKVLSCPWVLGSKSEMIRTLKWSTLGSRTPGGSRNTSRQSFIFFLPILTACIFGTTGSSGTQCGSKNTSHQSWKKKNKTLTACIFRTTGSSGTQCTSF